MQPVQLWPWFLSRGPGTAASTPVHSVHWRCLQAVCTGVRSLGLDGLQSASVLLLKIPAAVSLGAANVPLPSVLVTPYGPEHMNRLQGTNRNDDVEYPVLVSIVDRDNQDPTAGRLDQYLNWREQIARAFRNQKLPAVPEIIGCWVEPSTIVQPESWMKGFFHSSLLFWFVSREPRGM
jgi:hypothetical protein